MVVSEDAVPLLVFDGMGGHMDSALAAATGLKVVQNLFMAELQSILTYRAFFTWHWPRRTTRSFALA